MGGISAALGILAYSVVSPVVFVISAIITAVGLAHSHKLLNHQTDAQKRIAARLRCPDVTPQERRRLEALYYDFEPNVSHLPPAGHN